MKSEIAFDFGSAAAPSPIVILHITSTVAPRLPSFASKVTVLLLSFGVIDLPDAV